MKLKIIKGINQIGGCITEITSNSGGRILIDFGKDLEDDDKAEEYELEGLTYGEAAYDAVFITHAHGDHIGLVYKILDSIPVYIEETTLLIHNITCDFMKDMEKIDKNVNIFSLNEEVIYDNKGIKVTPYFADHSAAHAAMFLIEADGKKILHSGDFRCHGRGKEEFIKAISHIPKVDVLVTEGTTLSRAGGHYQTEEELENDARELFSQYKQVLIMQSSTNVDRLQTFYNARGNKNFVIDTFTQAINKNIPSSPKKGWDNVYLWHPNVYKNKTQEFKDTYMIDETNCKFVPNFIMLVKQSMIYEIRKMVSNGMIKPEKTLFVYSLWPGYIEKEESLAAFIKEIEDMGITIIKKLHTSGHADHDALKYLCDNVNPDKTYVIHTENNEAGNDLFKNYERIEENKYIEV